MPQPTIPTEHTAPPINDPAPPGARRVTGRELGWAILGCALVATLFLSPALFTGRYLSPADMLYDYYPWRAVQPEDWTGPSNNGLSDSVLVFEPFPAYAARRLQSGDLPLWNPDNMLGAPFIGNMQSALFYPLNWPQLLGPGGPLIVASAWLKLFVALLGMYLLAREVARVGPAAAGIAAVSYGLGAFVVAWLLYSLASAAVWLPWLWWATARLVARPGPRPLAALALVAALSLLGGHPETALHMALAAGLWLLFQLWQTGPLQPRRVVVTLGAWVAGYALGALLAAIQIAPFIDYLTQSAALRARSGADAAGFWLPFRYAWTLISPDLFGNPARHNAWDFGTNYNESNTYIGMLPLLLAPFALFSAGRGGRRLALFLLALTVLAAGVVYHWPLIFDAALALPLLQVGANNRLTLIIQLALALLAALGAEAFGHHLAQGRRRPAGGLALITAALLVGGIGGAWVFRHGIFTVPVESALANQTWQDGLLRALPALAVSSGVLAGWLLLGARGRAARLAPALALVVLLADLGQARGDYHPTVAPTAYFPDTPATQFLQQQPGPFRTVATDWLFMPNTNLWYGIAHLGGYDALEPQLYKELAQRIDPAMAPSGGGGLHPFHTIQSRIINLLNVRYVLAAPGEDPNYFPLARQEAVTGNVDEIRRGARPGQTFRSLRSNLARIEVLGSTYGGRAAGRLIFHLKTDPAAPADLVTRELDVTRLPDNSYWPITFPPIPQSQGQTFYFYFEPLGAEQDHATTLWFNTQDNYVEGARMQGAKVLPGDLVFRAFALLDPDDPWFQRVLDGGRTGAGVFENRQALPRAWLTHQVEVVPDPAARLLRLRNPDFDEAGTALLAAPLPPDQPLPSTPPAPGADTVTITRYAPEQVEITADSPAPGLLILADQAFSGWTATVDGQPAPILTADHALRAVYLPAGAHTVRFVYQPLSFTLGAAGTGIGFLVLGLLLAAPRRRARRRPS